MKKKSIDGIRKEIISAEKEKVTIAHQIKRLENRANYYLQADRRKRVHHLCNIGGAIEALFPVSKTLSKTEFFELMEKVAALPDVASLVKEVEIATSDSSVAESEKDVI